MASSSPTIVLGYPSLPHDKVLLLKTPHNFTNRKPTRTLPLRWLALLVPVSAVQVAVGESRGCLPSMGYCMLQY
ncbi:hypothetical protein ACRRTK_000220 [Alexandromys fortis]